MDPMGMGFYPVYPIWFIQGTPVLFLWLPLLGVASRLFLWAPVAVWKLWSSPCGVANISKNPWNHDLCCIFENDVAEYSKCLWSTWGGLWSEVQGAQYAWSGLIEFLQFGCLVGTKAFGTFQLLTSATTEKSSCNPWCIHGTGIVTYMDG